jgi:hypothetical protein
MINAKRAAQHATPSSSRIRSWRTSMPR